MSIEKLLKKYEGDGYVRGEYESSKRRRQREQKNLLKKRLRILDQLILEAPRLNLTRFEKEKVQYLIEKYSCFRKLYNHAATETIILAFIFYVKIDSDSNIKVEKWSICKKYKLNTRTYSLILTRLFSLTLKKKPLPIKKTTSYYHSILEKQSL